MNKKKGKRIKNVKGKTLILPEEVIQQIQSFMSGKEAARSAILSKSRYDAWLTRPTIDLDEQDFDYYNSQAFEEFARKTMQRYRDLSLKIESFSLFSRNDSIGDSSRHNLIVSAINMGATHLKLTLPHSSFILPQEVLGSQTLVKLFLYGFKFEGSYVINCSMLKSLTLDNVNIRHDDVFKDLTSRCISMEELSLSFCLGLELRRTNMYELHKLKRLFLKYVDVDNMFFTDFASRFPCLKDLTIHNCYGCTSIHIAATSVQTVSFKPKLTNRSDSAKFDVPNIRKFSYSTSGLPSPSRLSINGASSWEWDLDISIACYSFPKTSWFVNLKKLLNKFTLSRISLFMDVSKRRIAEWKHEVDVEVVPNPLVLENLMIHAPPTLCCAFLVRSFGVFRPKFVTHPWPHRLISYSCTIDVRDRLIELLFISNWEDMFGQFGLRKVNMEIYKEFDKEWRPLRLRKSVVDRKAKVRLQLIWEN